MKARTPKSLQQRPMVAKANAHPPSAARVQRLWLRIAQVLWLGVMALALWYTSAAVRLLASADVVFLYDAATFVERLGLSPAGYAQYILALFLIVAVSYFAVAAIIVWRRPHDWFALFVSLMLIMVEAGIVVAICTGNIEPSLASVPVGDVFFVLSLALPVLLFYLFPNGRFVPRGTGLLALAWIAWIGVVLWSGLGRIRKPRYTTRYE